MRVAYVTSAYPLLSHTFVRREVDGLRRLGVEVDTFSVRRAPTPSDPGDPDHEAARTTTSLLPLELPVAARAHLRAATGRPAAYVRALRATVGRPRGLGELVRRLGYFVEGIVVWWHCRRRGIRHVHAHFANVGADVARLAARFGTAWDPDRPWTWSFTMHGPTEFLDVERYALREKAAEADAVVCISDFCRSQMMMLTSPDRWDRMHVVHCGVDPAEFAPGAPLPHGPLRVLCVGRLTNEKGQPVLVEAVEALLSQGHDVSLTLVGDGPSRSALEAMVRSRGLGSHVEVVGAVPSHEIRERYRAADVFALPSFAEGVPVVLMEAMSCELPVVSTTIAGIPELVEDGVSGLLVPPGRPDLVAEALARLRDPELRRRMGRAGRGKVEEAFDIADAPPRLREIFNSLAGAADITDSE